MIFPTFAVVVGALLVVCDAGFTKSLEAVNAYREKALSGKAIQDVFPKKAASAALAVAPETTYATTGWLVMGVYGSAGCGDPLYADGWAVNTCYKNNAGTTSYMYQLTGNSCDGAIQQTFTDDACTTGMATIDLTIESGCQADTLFYEISTCTTSTTAIMPFQAVQLTYSRDATCATGSSLTGIPTNECFDTEKFSCSGGTASMTSYTGSDCSGTATSETAPSTCLSDDDDDNSGNYYAGAQSDSYNIMCNGNGASGLFNSMSVKAVAALVVGVVAFLAV